MPASAGHSPPLHPSHGGLLPHWHDPAVQLSAMLGSHAVHVPPSAPQAPNTDVVQVCPEQQPPGHEVESHTQLPPEHR